MESTTGRAVTRWYIEFESADASYIDGEYTDGALQDAIKTAKEYMTESDISRLMVWPTRWNGHWFEQDASSDPEWLWER